MPCDLLPSLPFTSPAPQSGHCLLGQANALAKPPYNLLEPRPAHHCIIGSCSILSLSNPRAVKKPTAAAPGSAPAFLLLLGCGK